MDGIALNNLLPRMGERAFFTFCQENPNLRIEQDKHGNILIMPPVSYQSGHHESEINGDLVIWNRHHKLGKTFSSQTLFVLPDGEKRMPDAAWVSNEKDQAISKKERKSFAHVVPDFVVEIASPSDTIPALRRKMQEVWMANGVRLAWLIDTMNEKVYIFSDDNTETLLEGFDQSLSGEPVLSGFVIDLQVLKD